MHHLNDCLCVSTFTAARSTRWRCSGHPVHPSLFNTGTGWRKNKKNKRGLSTTCTNTCTRRAWLGLRCAIHPFWSIRSPCTRRHFLLLLFHPMRSLSLKSKVVELIQPLHKERKGCMCLSVFIMIEICVCLCVCVWGGRRRRKQFCSALFGSASGEHFSLSPI